MSRKVGRPSQESDVREALLNQAKHLFTTMPYDKVSTRLLAEKAGVNSAMIRYYFGNKEGLFEAMVKSVMAPIIEAARNHHRDSDSRSLFEMMRTHYRVMSQDPEFPRMISRVMNMPSTEVQQKIVSNLFDELVGAIDDDFFETFDSSKTFREGLDYKKCRLSVISLMMFPFIAPKVMLTKHNIELTDEFLASLLEHNMMVLSSGILPYPEINQDGTE